MALEITATNPTTGQNSLTIEQSGTLLFEIRNTGAEITGLQQGAAVAETAITPTDPSTLYLNMSDLTDPSAMSGLTVNVSGWKPVFIAAGPAWALVPLATTTNIPALGSIRVTVSGLKPTGSPRPSYAGVDQYNFPGLVKTELQPPVALINAPAGQTTPLPVKIAFASDAVIRSIDPRQPLTPNTLKLTISNTSASPLVSPSSPPVAPLLLLSFVYGDAPGYGALTTGAQAKATMTVKVSQLYVDDFWVNPMFDGDRPYWTLTPKTIEVLGTGEGVSVELEIDGVETALDKGVTLVYLQWTGFPNHDDGCTTTSLRKVDPSPTFIATSPDVINTGDPVDLVWSTFDIAAVKLWWVDGTTYEKFSPADIPLSGTYSPTPVPQGGTTSVVTYHLDWLDAAGNRVGSSQPIDIGIRLKPTITAFSATPCLIDDISVGENTSSDWTTSLVWTTEAHEVYLDDKVVPANPPPPGVTGTFPRDQRVHTFELIATSGSQSTTVSLLVPTITWFLTVGSVSWCGTIPDGANPASSSSLCFSPGVGAVERTKSNFDWGGGNYHIECHKGTVVWDKTGQVLKLTFPDRSEWNQSLTIDLNNQDQLAASGEEGPLTYYRTIP